MIIVVSTIRLIYQLTRGYTLQSCFTYRILSWISLFLLVMIQVEEQIKSVFDYLSKNEMINMFHVPSVFVFNSLLQGRAGLDRTWVSQDKRIKNSQVHFKILEKIWSMQNNISYPGIKFDKSTLSIYRVIANLSPVNPAFL